MVLGIIFSFEAWKAVGIHPVPDLDDHACKTLKVKQGEVAAHRGLEHRTAQELTIGGSSKDDSLPLPPSSAEAPAPPRRSS